MHSQVLAFIAGMGAPTILIFIIGKAALDLVTRLKEVREDRDRLKTELEMQELSHKACLEVANSGIKSQKRLLGQVRMLTVQRDQLAKEYLLTRPQIDAEKFMKMQYEAVRAEGEMYAARS